MCASHRRPNGWPPSSRTATLPNNRPSGLPHTDPRAIGPGAPDVSLLITFHPRRQAGGRLLIGDAARQATAVLSLPPSTSNADVRLVGIVDVERFRRVAGRAGCVNMFLSTTVQARTAARGMRRRRGNQAGHRDVRAKDRHAAMGRIGEPDRAIRRTAISLGEFILALRNGSTDFALAAGKTHPAGG